MSKSTNVTDPYLTDGDRRALAQRSLSPETAALVAAAREEGRIAGVKEGRILELREMREDQVENRSNFDSKYDGGAIAALDGVIDLIDGRILSLT